jgi:uncharacterized protein YgiM (DUF1202 family)
MLRRASLAALVLALAPLACTNDDDTPPQEPVAPTDEAPVYPADAAAAPETDTSAPDFPASSETPPPSTEADAAAAQADATPQPPAEEMTGELSDDPLGAPKDIPTMKDDASEPDSFEQQTSPAPGAAADDSGIDADATGAFDEPAAAAPSGAPAHVGKAPRKSAGHGGAGKSKAAAGGAHVTRYVDAIMLNVRSKPTPRAPVVRRLLGGAKITVSDKGRYAKIKDGEWVRTKFLSAQPTREVSQDEADAAWHGGKPAATHAAKASKKSAKAASASKGKGKSKGKTAKAKATAKSKSNAPQAEPAAQPAAANPDQGVDPADPIPGSEPDAAFDGADAPASGADAAP